MAGAHVDIVAASPALEPCVQGQLQYCFRKLIGEIVLWPAKILGATPSSHSKQKK